ncbi:Ail/Lom family outer membrane beta-barrel protein [Escherichia coli]|uniref:Ail/Lom family outer membrane beta-barrel protein n=1 Tax=Escherichia coli TaxID=562 RepID=UPI003C776FA7
MEAVGRASDDAEGYLDFFKGQITESHLGKELLEKVELTEDNASKLEEFSKEWKDASDKWNAMWGVKIEQTKDGKHYVAGIGLSMEDTEEGKLSQFLVAANRIAFIDPANGNETPMFVAQGNQIFMNDVFSAYAMAGVAYSRVSTFSGDYLRVTDNKGKTHDVLTGSDDARHSNTSLAWGAGVQFNPSESVAIDIAYEGSGSGDWRTDGFIVGVGYKF